MSFLNVSENITSTGKVFQVAETAELKSSPSHRSWFWVVLEPDDWVVGLYVYLHFGRVHGNGSRNTRGDGQIFLPWLVQLWLNFGHLKAGGFPDGHTQGKPTTPIPPTHFIYLAEKSEAYNLQGRKEMVPVLVR